MGLLDGYPFDSRFYGDAGPAGGILGMLLKNMPDLPMPQAGGGFPAQNLPPTDVSAASVQPQAQPQQVPDQGLLGSLGGALGSLFSPSQANAGPMQQAPQGASPGLLDHLTSAWQGLGHGGLTSALGGLITGQRQDPQGVMERALVNNYGASPDVAHAAVTNPQFMQMAGPMLLAGPQQAQTYQALKSALLAKGASPQQADALARTAALDPEFKKTLMPTIYQAPQLIDTGTNPLTGEKGHAVYNPNNQTASPLGLTQGGGAAQTLTPQNAAAVGLPSMSNNELTQIDMLNRSGVQGDDYYSKLKNISPAFADKVKGMANGDIPYPSGFIMKTLYGGMLTDAISALKPGVTAQDYAAKQAAQKAWTSGPDAAAVKSVNQAVTHADKAWKLIDRLPNLNIGGPIGSYVNGAYLGVRATGDQQYQSDKQEYSKLIQALSGELMAASRGSGHGSVEEIRQWRDGAMGAASPAEMRGSIRGAMDFLDGAANALAAKKTAAFKSQNAVKADDLFEPGQKDKFDRIQQSSETGSSNSQGQPKQASPNLPQVKTPADAAKLPKGTHFLDPNGVERIVP